MRFGPNVVRDHKSRAEQVENNWITQPQMDWILISPSTDLFCEVRQEKFVSRR